MNTDNAYPIVLLHGWGFSSRIWQPLIQALHQQKHTQVFAIDLPGFGSAFHEPCNTLAQTLDYIVEQLPEKCVLCGWSLGGMLAAQIAAHWPEKVARIITIGSNMHFIQDGDWPGMPRNDYAQFCQRFDAQPEKTWQRFLGLQTRGDNNVARSDAMLAAVVDYRDCHPHTASRLLDLLGNIDNRTLFPTLKTPGLHVFGSTDAITPVAVAMQLQHSNPRQIIKILSGRSHALPISDAAGLAIHISQFLENKTGAPKKSRIANSFSQAANTYDNAARLQQKTGAALLASLPETMQGVALDVGCGTGFIGAALQKKYSTALDVFAIDIASRMLQSARAQHQLHCVQADMESLPLANQSADWLLSSLALQWANDTTHCFTEWRRVLKQTGTLFFTTFLPGTLKELQESWRTVDSDVHVNHFIAEETLVANLHTAGFTRVDALAATHTLYYPQLRDLAGELKAIGAHNMNAGQPRGLTGKNRWTQLVAAYETLRTERGLPATYEILYVTAC